MAGPYDSFVGELAPGDDGWLPLDDAGFPSGPATKAPPPISVKACAVQANAEVPLPDNAHLLLSESGAELQPPLINNTERRVGEAAPPPVLPAITAVSPDTGVVAVDLPISVTGTGLSGATNISLGGSQIPVDAGGTDTSVSGTIPGASMVEPSLQIMVITPGGASNQLPITVTPVARDARHGPQRRN